MRIQKEINESFVQVGGSGDLLYDNENDETDNIMMNCIDNSLNVSAILHKPSLNDKSAFVG